MSFLDRWFAYPWVLGLVFTLPVLLVAYFAVEQRRRRALQQLTGGHELHSLSRWRRGLRFGCGLMGVGLVIIGSAGTQWGRDPQGPPSEGRDILIVLDVSRSMLAEDPPRSRLSRAKQYLSELTDTLQRRGGYRLGLVLFAGQAKLSCPLTEDYDHFRFAVGTAHPDYFGMAGRLGEGEVGTRLDQALKLAVSALDPGSAGFQEIIVISDGDDLADDEQSGWEAARATGMPVHALGVGDSKNASRIPLGSGYLQFQGQWVTTRRQDNRLQILTEATGGAYYAEEAAAQPLVHWFQMTVAPKGTHEGDSEHRLLYVQRFALFFAGALVLFAVETMLGDARRRE